MKRQFEDFDASDLGQMLRPRPADGHKGTFGHALLVAGSRGMAGAAILSAEACLRSGVGKLSIVTPGANRPLLQVAVPEAIVVDGAADGAYTGMGIGPGIGIDEDLVMHYIGRSEQTPCVIDADGLNTLASRPALQSLIRPGTILTPHPKEAERLFGGSDEEHVGAFVEGHGVYVVLKGHPTHVFMPDGEVVRLCVGNSGMGTAGSGDVLTGIITGLLAQGYAPREAALLGVWLHGTAGDYAARELTEYCMLARDITRHLPEAFGKLKIES